MGKRSGASDLLAGLALAGLALLALALLWKILKFLLTIIVSLTAHYWNYFRNRPTSSRTCAVLGLIFLYLTPVAIVWDYYWSRMDYVPPESTATNYVKCYYVNTDVANIRAGASTEASIVGKLLKGQKVEVAYGSEENEKWTPIRYADGIAYIHKSLLIEQDSAIAASSAPAVLPKILIWPFTLGAFILLLFIGLAIKGNDEKIMSQLEGYVPIDEKELKYRTENQENDKLIITVN